MAALLRDQLKQAQRESNLWPTSLLLNSISANTFRCTKCDGIPLSAHADGDGLILCTECAKAFSHTMSNKAIQRMIDTLKTRCLTRLQGASNNGGTHDQSTYDEGVVALASDTSDALCEWTGTIKEWPEHNTQCPFALIVCSDCHEFECSRKAMQFHVCPKKRVACPLQCGLMVLLQNRDHHLLAECPEQTIECRNCKMQTKRANLKQHVKQECEHRWLPCEFAKFGCSVKRIKAKDMRRHCEEYKIDHISQKFDFISTQQQKVISNLQHQVEKQTLAIQKLQSQSWKNVVFAKKGRPLDKSGQWTCPVSMILPQRNGRYLCRYSFLCFAAADNVDGEEHWVGYCVKRGNTLLHPSPPLQPGTQICHSTNEKEQVPISGSFPFVMQGDEIFEDRKIGLWHMGNAEFPSGMSRCCLECYEL